MGSKLDVDKLFVSKIVQDGDITPVADIPPYFLFDSDYREAFEYIRQYYAEHGTVPTVRVMQSDCPVALTRVEEPWEDIIQRVQHKYIKGILTEKIAEIDAYTDAGDIKEATNLLGITASLVHTVVPNKRDVDATQTGEERLARYRERRDNPGSLVGIPTGFPTLDKATQGLQKGQLITVTGLTKASKSALSLKMAMTAQEYGMRVLYITFEMTCDEQTNRLDAYRAGFNDNKLNSGMLTDDDMAALTKGIHLTASLPTMVFSEDTMTVTAIGAKADIVEPDIIIVDGVYMMEDESGEPTGSAQALANIVKGLKFLAMRRKICVVAVTQSTPARTKGESLNNDSIMGSRAFGQYSNVVIGIERTPDVTIRKVRILFSRSCPPCDAMVQFDFDTATFEELENYELDGELGDLLDNGEYETNF